MDISSWDWDPGTKPIHDLNKCDLDVKWLEEPYASPDGERIACLARLEEGYDVCVNGQPWGQEFEIAYYLRFSPDGRLTCLASSDFEWSLAVEGETWSVSFGNAWNTLFSRNGKSIAAAIQQDGQYGMVVDEQPWEQLHLFATDFALSPDGGKSAAVVQTTSLSEGDIFTFQQGCFNVALNGETWEGSYVNAWTPTFDPDGQHLAAQIRTSLYDYTIVVDGKPWNASFSMVWEPVFHPREKKVTAPVRQAGKWGMAQDGQIIWEPRYFQLWQQKHCHEGNNLYAIGAPEFGRWTIIQNDVPWPVRVSSMLADLEVSPDGRRAAAAAKEGGYWSIMADQSLWSDWYDMVWSPVFSPDSQHIACKVEKGGRYTVVLDGKPFKEEFSHCFEPIFSPDSRLLLIRGVQDGKYKRIVSKLDEF